MLVPALALVLGVLLVRAVSGGTTLLATVATVGAPAGAALCGFAAGWRAPWWTAAAATVLYGTAWFGSGLIAEAAGVALIGGCCLFLARWVAGGASPRAIVAGLVLLVAVDCVLVLGLDAVRPATIALHAARPVGSPLGGGHPLPDLQDATFGTALMGWLDIFAPAVLAVLMMGARTPRFVAAAATVVAGWAWGALLIVRPEIPATVPVLAGCGVWFLHLRLKNHGSHLESPA